MHIAGIRSDSTTSYFWYSHHAYLIFWIPSSSNYYSFGPTNSGMDQ